MLKAAKGEKSLRYRIVIAEDEDGEFVAECRAFRMHLSGEDQRSSHRKHPGSIKDTGKPEEARRPIPPSISEEIVEVNV